MNEDQHIDSEPIDQELLRQLERATAPVFLEQETSPVQETGSDNDIVDDEAVDDEAVDSETRSLRQTWLAFGSLLDAAQSPPSTAIAVELPPRQTAAKWWTVSAALAAAAAVILLTVTLRWSATPVTTEPNVAGPNIDSAEPDPVATSIVVRDLDPGDQSAPDSVDRDSEESDAPEESIFQAEEPAPRLALDAGQEDAGQEDAAQDLLAWDDGFDDQLSQVSQAVLAADERWYELDAPFTTIQTQLEEFEDQFTEESL